MKALDELQRLTGAGKCSCSFAGCEHDKIRDEIEILRKKLDVLVLTKKVVPYLTCAAFCRSHDPAGSLCTCGLIDLQEKLEI